MRATITLESKPDLLQCPTCLRELPKPMFEEGYGCCSICLRQFRKIETEISQVHGKEEGGRLNNDQPELPPEGALEENILLASFKEQIIRAHIEGRVHPSWAKQLGLETGQYLCPVCGLRAWTLEDTEQCCIPGLLEYEKTLDDQFKQFMAKYDREAWSR